MILVFPDRDGHEHFESGAGLSRCFYDREVDITDFVASLIEQKKRVVIRTARIEVADEVESLHAHAGFTMGFVLSGTGRLATCSGDRQLGTGDRFAFGPGVMHLSIADENRTLVEGIVYIGEPGDQQKVVDDFLP